MLNEVKIPPPQDPGRPQPRATDPARTGASVAEDRAHLPKEPGVKPHEHIRPHIDPNEPGTHHARIMGERTKIDPIYAMPMEDRGSFFSLMLSAAVVLIVAIVLVVVWVSLN